MDVLKVPPTELGDTYRHTLTNTPMRPRGVILVTVPASIEDRAVGAESCTLKYLRLKHAYESVLSKVLGFQ
jgi:hypothetical protein